VAGIITFNIRLNLRNRKILTRGNCLLSAMAVESDQNTTQGKGIAKDGKSDR
jgi:hypothetical protein